MINIYYSSKFNKSYRKIPQIIKILAEKKEKVFIKDPFDKRLKTHKLHDDFEGFWSFWINKSYRIVFDFHDNNIVRFYDIGTHEVYK